MDNNALLYILAAFVAVSAIALCIQAGLLYQIYMTTKRLQEKVEPLVPKVDALVASAKMTIDQSRKQIIDITTKTNEILDSTKNQLKKVEEVVDDATSRAKVQMERVEMVLDDTMSRAHETVAAVHSGILRPLREINGIAVGVRAAIGHLARGARPSVAQATSDEEMFI
jgi:polyhydroxyalkanoate synthesis regulator phasin